MRPCPHCSKEIKDNAELCKWCQRPVPPPGVEAPGSNPVIQAREAWQAGARLFQTVLPLSETTGFAVPLRDPASHEAQLKAFFARTKGDFTRFNYLGEWHSHPMFAPVPSETDCHSMQSIVDNPEVGVNFVVLLVVKLASRTKIEGTAMVFRPQLPSMNVVVFTDDIGLASRLGRTVPSWLYARGSKASGRDPAARHPPF